MVHASGSADDRASLAGLEPRLGLSVERTHVGRSCRPAGHERRLPTVASACHYAHLGVRRRNPVSRKDSCGGKVEGQHPTGEGRHDPFLEPPTQDFSFGRVRSFLGDHAPLVQRPRSPLVVVASASAGRM